MKKIKTIIIDDEINNVKLLYHFLNRYCPKVEIIGSSCTISESIDLINQLDADLILLDIQLNGGNAFDLLEQVDLKKAKIIYVSAYDEHVTRIKGSGYITKPIRIEVLKEAVDALSFED